MAVKSFKPNLEGADLEKIKAVCYPCTSQNDCSRRLNNKQATVEECNGAYKLFDIDPPPVNYSPPKKVGTRRFERAQSRPSGRESRQEGGLGTVLFAAFLPISSYSSSCILSLCSIYFVVSAAAKQ
tara:strand:+ start:775 stop:1152 length:378 start_codon:yes stop_codon:yes gene_type:complete